MTILLVYNKEIKIRSSGRNS